MVELCRHLYHEGYTEDGEHALICSVCGEVIYLGEDEEEE